MKFAAFVIFLASLIPIVCADSLPVGTWIRRANKDGVSSILIIEAEGTGRKLTFNIAVAGAGTSKMIVTTQGDGKDATVSIDGRPSAETMAIRIIDDRHTTNLIKMGGKPMTTQKSEVSADGKVIRVESTPMDPNAQNTVEYWDKK